ncbi:hypothetical protein D3C78_1161750 [compost metagenome]
MGTHPPALAGTLALATEQQRQQLMTETHTQQLVATLVACQQKRFEGFDPRIIAERVGLAASHQVGIEYLVISGVFAVHHVVYVKLGGDRLPGEQLLEHPSVALILPDQLGSQDVGFQDADA